MLVTVALTVQTTMLIMIIVAVMTVIRMPVEDV